MAKTEWDNMIRRSALRKLQIPPGVIDRFERENPEAVVKMNPLAPNSPRLYDKNKFDAWWNRCCQAQALSRKRGVM